MDVDKSKSIEAMRTFARDLERVKGAGENTEPEKNQKKETDKKATTTPVPEPKPERKEKKISSIKENIKVSDKKPPEPKSLPALHKLQKAIKTDIDATTKKNEVPLPKKKKGIEPTKAVAGGTVITDTKKNKRPFFADVSKSLKDWFEKLKNSLTPTKKNTYEVTQTNRRKGVVQKATSKTGTIFSADGDTLKEQIKARQRAEKHEHDDDDLSWSPYTEPGYPLLEGDEVESVDPRVVKVAVTQKTTAAPKPVIKSTEKIPELHEQKEEATLEALVDEVGVEIPLEPVKETPTQEGVVTEPELKRIVVEEASEEEAPKQTLIERLKNFSLEDTNTLAMLLVGVLLAIGIFGFVIFGIFDAGSEDQTTPVTTPDKAIYSGATLDSITISSRSFNEVVTKTNSALVEVLGDTNNEFKYVQGNGAPLSADVLMHLIQTDTSDGFANTVTSVRFVKASDRNRALILTTPDKTVTLGGMLNWEPTLLSDLGLLLNMPSVPPNAGEFADMQYGSLDVRALMFDGNPLLVYAIINESDVIIGNNLTVLSPFTQN